MRRVISPLVLLLALSACPGSSLPKPDPTVLFGLSVSPTATATATTPASSVPATASGAPSVLPAGGSVPAVTSFLNGSIGFGVDYACSGSQPLRCTYRLSASRDGGTSWRPAGTQIQATQQVDRAPGVQFVSERHGWVFGDALYETTDTGATWKRVSDPEPGTAPCGKIPEPIAQFVAGGRDQWIVAGSCRTGACPGVYTSAGGRGQVCRADPRNPLENASILLTAEAVFALVGEGREPAWVARSLDGGRSWNLRESPCGLDDGATLAALGKTRVWLACYDEPGSGMQSGRVFENPDFGETWYVRSDTGLFGRSDPERRRTGNLPGDGHAGDLLALPNGELVLTRSKFGSIHRSVDGGRTWTLALNNPEATGYRLQFIDARAGWAHSGSGLHRTTDGGRSWRLVAGSAGA